MSLYFQIVCLFVFCLNEVLITPDFFKLCMADIQISKPLALLTYAICKNCVIGVYWEYHD